MDKFGSVTATIMEFFTVVIEFFKEMLSALNVDLGV